MCVNNNNNNKNNLSSRTMANWALMRKKHKIEPLNYYVVSKDHRFVWLNTAT